MTEVVSPCLLCLGLSVPTDSPDAVYVQAESPERALQLLRLFRFDLVVVTVGTISRPLPEFIRQIRQVCPDMKWVLVSTPGSDPILPQDELEARCHGALAVLDLVQGLDDLTDLVCSVRKRPGTLLVRNV